MSEELMPCVVNNVTRRVFALVPLEELAALRDRLRLAEERIPLLEEVVKRRFADIERLAEEKRFADAVVKDLSTQIIEAREIRKAEETAAGHALAFAIPTRDGEFDYWIFPDHEGAKSQAAQEDQDRIDAGGDRDAPSTPVIPLYAIAAWTAATPKEKT